MGHTGSMHPLIDVPTLAGELAEQPRPALLDVRWRLTGPPGIEDYREGHIPGAVFVDLDRGLAGEPGSQGRHPLPETTAFQDAMRASGVGAGQPVVVYDEGNAAVAGRAWWLLRYFGHENVRVLDGGYRAWRDGGYPVTAAEPDVQPGDFVAMPGGMPVLDAHQALEVSRSGVLLDVRAPERFRGETEPIDPVAGHVPGAVNAPATRNLDSEGRFLPPRALRERFDALGAGERGPVGAYCGSGVTAAHEVLALDLAGIPASLYVGSWSHWITDPARPVATGP